MDSDLHLSNSQKNRTTQIVILILSRIKERPGKIGRIGRDGGHLTFAMDIITSIIKRAIQHHERTSHCFDQSCNMLYIVWDIEVLKVHD